MSFVAKLTDLMPHTVTVAAVTTRSNYAKPTYSTSPTSYTSRVVREHKMVRDAGGEEVLSTTTVWIASTSANINPSSKITLPDGTTPPILSVETQADENGQTHVKLYLGA